MGSSGLPGGRGPSSFVQSRTLFLINLAAIMESADERLLPAVYQEVGVALKASPSKLGTLTFTRALVQALFSPMAGFLAMHYDRGTVIGIGTIIWAGATLIVGLSTTYFQAMIGRAITGVGLAIVIPAIQSFVADSHEEGRGLAFGWLNLTGNVGGIGGSMAATMLAGGRYFGMDGWRVAFVGMAVISLGVGWLVYAYVVDPRPVSEGSGPGTFRESLSSSMTGVRSVLKLRSFQLIIAQGVIGSIPWQSLVFFTMWLQLIGFSHSNAAYLMGLFSTGCAFGAVFGGWLGDRAAKRFPGAGRIMCAQYSAGSGVPFTWLLLLMIPQDPQLFWLYGALLFLMATSISWCQSACNNPIFADIVPPDLRTTIYAFDRAFEGSLSALAAPLVGVLAEVMYGYKFDVLKASEPSAANARALSNGLFACMAPSFGICAATYGLLYATYHKDKDRVDAKVYKDRERRPLKMEEVSNAAFSL
ncbi:major facilitator superfamily protein [Klebsormidium nitens]|uniref:Major facilitator superfamily protein n=1 Tax=Klebsormidium nitens TaxID=105231 RepID=A0A1Y1HH76_KLENI|nr:major facilitator superfamily protein [Klebsormidium nitens]|eukprot:GAQ77780.1 major facilitator superfamily protein [Klebsormidium nitens]